MKQVDYIIVGCGLAGIAFCEQLRANNKSYVVFDNSSQKSSVVAGGLYNPVVLKRFSAVWKSKAQLDIAIPSYKAIEKLLNTPLDFEVPVYRLFKSIEEQNNWFAASDKVGLTEFLSPEIIPNTNTRIDAPFGYGRVLHTGRVDTKKLVKYYKNYLKESNQLLETSFDYEAITFKEDDIIYKEYQAKYIIFAEGFGLKKNPFFSRLPLKGTKGELLTIHAPDLNIDYVVKSSVFVIPLGDDLYRVGSTYNNNDKTDSVTPEAQEELLTKFKRFVKCDFTVMNHVTGIRPTVKDRRPLVGEHTEHKNLYVLNGLGSRGVMIAPYVAKQLFSFIEHHEPLDSEIDIVRFIS